MHARDRLLDGLVWVLELAVLAARVPHLIRRRVSHRAELNHLVVFGHAVRTKRLVVSHAETIDRLVMPSANRIVHHLVHRRSVLSLHPRLHPLPWHIVIHFYLIVLLVIDSRK